MTTRPRPTVVLVIAILQFVGGGLGLAGDLLGIGMQALGGNAALTKAFTPRPPPGSKAPPELIDAETYMKKAIPHYTAYFWSHLGLDTLLSLLMIVSGLGLIAMQAWGLRLAFVYAVYSIVLRLFQVTYSLIFIVPTTLALVELQQQQLRGPMPPQMAQTMRTATTVATYFGVLFQLVWIIYPIVVLILLSRKSVRQAFHTDDVGDAEPAYE